VMLTSPQLEIGGGWPRGFSDLGYCDVESLTCESVLHVSGPTSDDLSQRIHRVDGDQMELVNAYFSGLP
jgi:hypothetical protein